MNTTLRALTKSALATAVIVGAAAYYSSAAQARSFDTIVKQCVAEEERTAAYCERKVNMYTISGLLTKTNKQEKRINALERIVLELLKRTKV